MGKKLKERAKVDFDEELPDDDDVALSRLKSIFDSTYEVLRELAEEKGIAIEDIYRAENIDRVSGAKIMRIWTMMTKSWPEKWRGKI